MSSGTATHWADSARERERLAAHRTSPERRDQRLQHAREWMHAVIDEEDASGATAK